MKEKKTLILGLTAIALSLAFTLIMLEIFFRFLPVPTGMSPIAVTQEQPVAKFAPNQDVTWSDEWNFTIVNHFHVNNDGFVNDQDYASDDPRPLFAVIGDSYVEAAMVPYANTIQGRLSNAVGDDKRVYSFAASGAPLSQYLIWAQYARDTYEPEAMAFVIVGNDFDESLPQYVLHQIFHQFVPDENGKLKPELLQEFHPSWKRALVKSSALARYMFYNLNAWLTWNRLKQKTMRQNLNQEKAFVGNTSASTDEQRIEDSKKAVDAFFNLLPAYSGLKARDIAIIVDSSRGWIYNGEDTAPDDNYFDIMRRYMINAGRKKGYTVIDMDVPFQSHFKEHQKRFEYPTDGHWNDMAHGIAAKELESTALFKRFIAR